MYYYIHDNTLLTVQHKPSQSEPEKDLIVSSYSLRWQIHSQEQSSGHRQPFPAKISSLRESLLIPSSLPLPMAYFKIVDNPIAAILTEQLFRVKLLRSPDKLSTSFAWYVFNNVD